MARPVIVGAIAIALGSSARATPGSDPTIGRGVFTGAATEHATSLELDPAALGLGTSDQIYVAASTVIDQISIDRRDLDLASGTFTPGARIRDTEVGPGVAIGAIWHALGRVTLGGSISTPPSEQFVSGEPAIGYHTLGGYQRDLRFSAGFGIRVNARFRFGFSLTFDNAHLRLQYLRDTALENGRGPRGIDDDCGSGTPCGLGNPAAAEKYDVDVQQPISFKVGYIVNLGFVVTLVENMFLAVAYHTPPGGSIQTQLTGQAEITGAPRDGSYVSSGEATINVSLPASIDTELRARVAPGLDLHVGGRWIDLSRLYAYDVRIYGSGVLGKGFPEWTQRPRGLHDTFALWGGVEQVDTHVERLRYGARLGFETSGVTDGRTSPMTIAPSSITADVGAQLRISSALVAQLTYGAQYYPKVAVGKSAFDPRDRLDCIAASFDYSTPACQAVRDGYAISTAAGDYGKLEHAIRIGLSYAY